MNSIADVDVTLGSRNESVVNRAFGFVERQSLA
jgi:hypothetical protein